MEENHQEPDSIVDSYHATHAPALHLSYAGLPRNELKVSCVVSHDDQLKLSPYQMVLRQHGHRDRVHPAPQSTLQWPLAVLDLYRLVCFQRLSLLPLLPHFAPPLHSASSDMGCDDSPSCAIALSWDVSYGARDDRQYGGICVRSCLGTMGDNTGV